APVAPPPEPTKAPVAPNPNPTPWTVPPRPVPTLPERPTSCPPGTLASWDGCHPLPPPITLS
ncbi:glycosyl hydrolase family 26, partial [Kitasatospora sp. NPDC093806]